MFSLIIAIAALVLVVGIILATMYFGGNSFSSGKAAADAAGIVNGVAEINTAILVYRAEHGSNPTGTSEDIKTELLDRNYLGSFPLKDMAWTFEDGHIKVAGVEEAQCLEINKQQGIDHIPNCGDSSDTASICCNE